MFASLYDFFMTKVFVTSGNLYNIVNNLRPTLWGYQIGLQNYLSFLCALVSLIFIVILCCLFVYKIIKLIGGLIR